VLPDVELQQVDSVHAEVVAAALGVVTQVMVREHVVEPGLSSGRPLPVLRRNLGGDVEPVVRTAPEQIAEQPLAVTVAVCPGGIEERASQPDRLIERGVSGGVVGAGPAAVPTAHAPHPVATLAHRPAESPEPPISHRSSPPMPPTWAHCSRSSRPCLSAEPCRAPIRISYVSRPNA